MTKTRKNRFSKSSKKTTNIIKNIGRTTKKVLPVVKTGLSTIGQNVKYAANKSEPAIKQGFKTIYGTLATGFNMGLNKLSTFGKSYAKRREKHRVNRRTKYTFKKRRGRR
jgi:hypothetical protein